MGSYFHILTLHGIPSPFSTFNAKQDQTHIPPMPSSLFFVGRTMTKGGRKMNYIICYFIPLSKKVTFLSSHQKESLLHFSVCRHLSAVPIDSDSTDASSIWLSFLSLLLSATEPFFVPMQNPAREYDRGVPGRRIYAFSGRRICCSSFLFMM